MLPLHRAAHPLCVFCSSPLFFAQTYYENDVEMKRFAHGTTAQNTPVILSLSKYLSSVACVVLLANLG